MTSIYHLINTQSFDCRYPEAWNLKHRAWNRLVRVMSFKKTSRETRETRLRPGALQGQTAPLEVSSAASDPVGGCNPNLCSSQNFMTERWKQKELLFNQDVQRRVTLSLPSRSRELYRKPLENPRWQFQITSRGTEETFSTTQGNTVYVCSSSNNHVGFSKPPSCLRAPRPAAPRPPPQRFEWVLYEEAYLKRTWGSAASPQQLPSCSTLLTTPTRQPPSSPWPTQPLSGALTSQPNEDASSYCAAVMKGGFSGWGQGQFSIRLMLNLNLMQRTSVSR